MNNSNYYSDLTFDEKVMMAIVRAAENFKRTQSSIFKNHGLSFPQYNILRVLDASDGGQNKISVVGKIMLVPTANMTGLAKRLEQKNFIDRKADATDERVTLLSITKKGRDTIKMIEDEKNQAIDAILAGLTAETKNGFLDILKSIIKNTSTLQKEISG